MLQSGSNSDKIFDLKRCFAQSGGLSVNLNVHMGNLDLFRTTRRWMARGNL